jgi:hypothetical protein
VVGVGGVVDAVDLGVGRGRGESQGQGRGSRGGNEGGLTHVVLVSGNKPKPRRAAPFVGTRTRR